jgi:hypothetical protein
MTGTFPKFVSPKLVEESIIQTLLTYGVFWIAEAERQYGIPARSLPVPERGQFTTVSEVWRKWPEDQCPAVLVLAGGLTGEPRVEADRSMTAPVGIALGVIASSSQPGVGRELAQIYGAAYSQALLRHRLVPPVEDYVVEADGAPQFLDERWNDVLREEERFMGTSRVVFNIWIKNWRSHAGGPLMYPYEDDGPDLPDPYDPPANWPQVETVYPHITNTRSID